MGPTLQMSDPERELAHPVDHSVPVPPAFYARPGFTGRRAIGDWWTILHPPYTLWHLSYVVVGACLVGPVDSTRLIFTVIAFFLAVGIGAHALDELHGRPLNTAIPRRSLIAAAVLGIGGATVIGALGIERVGLPLAAFVVVGVIIAVGYNLELLGGRLHNDAMFAVGWGAFPVLTGYYAQHERLDIAAMAAAVFAFFMSSAQRQLSTPARALRRKTRDVSGTIIRYDGTSSDLERTTLLAPLEGALRALSWAAVTLAVALALARISPWP